MQKVGITTDILRKTLDNIQEFLGDVSWSKNSVSSSSRDLALIQMITVVLRPSGTVTGELMTKIMHFHWYLSTGYVSVNRKRTLYNQRRANTKSTGFGGIET